MDAAPALPAPVAGYHFDETTGNTAADYTGNGHTATVNGTVDGTSWVTTGQVNGALHLNGSDSSVSLPANLLQGATAFTVSIWANVDTNHNWSQLIDFGTDRGTYVMMNPQNGATGLTRFELKYGGNSGGGGAIFDRSLDGARTLPTGSWQHVAIVASNVTGIATLYVNGLVEAALSGVTLDPNFGTYPNYWIGQSEWGDPLFTGSVDELTVYNSALSADQVRELANQPFIPPPDAGPPPAPLAGYHFDETTGSTAADFTGNGHDATVNGTASWVTGQKNNALHFDGTSTYVSLPANLLQGATSFTIATWANADVDKDWTQFIDFGTDRGNAIIFDPQNGNDHWTRLEIKYGGDVNGNGDVFDRSLDGPSALPTGSWQHIAVVTTADGLATVYINGVMSMVQGGFQFDPNFGAYPNYWIGKSEYPDPLFNGAVDELLIYNQALTADQVKTLATP